MSPVTFLDANVPIYAAGRPHPLKQPSAEILRLAARYPRAFVTDVEVLQELLHRYLALRSWPQGRKVFLLFAELMEERVEAVCAADVERAARLADDHPESSGRDLLHAAVMERLRIRHVISADKDFDRLPLVERLDPSTNCRLAVRVRELTRCGDGPHWIMSAQVPSDYRTAC